VKALVTEYLEAFAARGIRELRIVRGKGTGALRRTVHALLLRCRWSKAFGAAESAGG